MRLLSALFLATFIMIGALPAMADNNVTTGTLVCTSGGTIAVTNSNAAITDNIIISLNTVGGTVSTVPAVSVITANSGFSVKCATSDTSTYNWAAVKYNNVP
jgi:hypothetical protein